MGGWTMVYFLLNGLFLAQSYRVTDNNAEDDQLISSTVVKPNFVNFYQDPTFGFGTTAQPFAFNNLQTASQKSDVEQPLFENIQVLPTKKLDYAPIVSYSQNYEANGNGKLGDNVEGQSLYNSNVVYSKPARYTLDDDYNDHSVEEYRDKSNAATRYGYHKKKGEVHYHQHKHLHEHDHKQDHVHKHNSGHHHDHHHGHKHQGSHKHEHSGKHEHAHKSEHEHAHQGQHNHDHKSLHAHEHKSGHKHGHSHSHKHDHHNNHSHDHKHNGEHSHDHHEQGKHGHHHDHKHEGHHSHDHHGDHKHSHSHKHGHHHSHGHHSHHDHHHQEQSKHRKIYIKHH